MEYRVNVSCRPFGEGRESDNVVVIEANSAPEAAARALADFDGECANSEYAAWVYTGDLNQFGVAGPEGWKDPAEVKAEKRAAFEKKVKDLLQELVDAL